jgi:hypothetical protein
VLAVTEIEKTAPHVQNIADLDAAAQLELKPDF